MEQSFQDYQDLDFGNVYPYCLIQQPQLSQLEQSLQFEVSVVFTEFIFIDIEKFLNTESTIYFFVLFFL
jgi:hypothetical protein